MINLNPIGQKEIHQLETVLLVNTLFRPEVLEAIKNSSDRLTWVDSLAVAAGALAREKAGKSVSEIAMEMGRSEQTIRNHLSKKTEAGKLVWETYEKLLKGELKDILELGEADKKISLVKTTLEEIKAKIEDLLNQL